MVVITQIMYPLFPYITSNIIHPIHFQNSLFEKNVLTVSSQLSSDIDLSHQPLHKVLTSAQPNPMATNQLDASNMDNHIF